MGATPTARSRSIHVSSGEPRIEQSGPSIGTGSAAPLSLSCTSAWCTSARRESRCEAATEMMSKHAEVAVSGCCPSSLTPDRQLMHGAPYRGRAPPGPPRGRLRSGHSPTPRGDRGSSLFRAPSRSRPPCAGCGAIGRTSPCSSVDSIDSAPWILVPNGSEKTGRCVAF